MGGKVEGKTVAVLGLSFKPETDDMRDSPSLPLVRALVAGGAVVRAFDPEAMENAKELLPESVVYCANAYDAAEGTDCLVIATEWNQFRSLNTDRLKTLMNLPVMVDLRNVCNPEKMREAGFTYDSVGRSATNLPRR